MELNIVLPKKKQYYIQNQNRNEKIEQLHVHPVEPKYVKKDLKWAKKYQPVYELGIRRKEPQYVLIYGGSREERLIAVSYLSGMILSKRSDVDNEMLEDDMDTENVCTENVCTEDVCAEDPLHIPLIKENELESFLTGKDDSILFGGDFLLGGQENQQNIKPYWSEHHREAVCVEMDLDFYYGESIHDMIENFRFFDSNSQVYILLQKGNNFFWNDENEFQKENSRLSESDIRYINMLKLHLLADEICLESGRSEEYDKVVFASLLKKYGLKAKKRFSYKNILQAVRQTNYQYDNTYLNQIVCYCKAERDKKDLKGNIVGEEDFDFLKLYEEDKQKVESGKKKSARNRLKDEFIGLDNVREQVLRLADMLKFNQCRKKMGLPGDYHNTHVMIGPPGTAKTSIAQLMGQMMEEEGLLPQARFIAVNGAELKGAYVGQTAPKVKALFEEYDCILIDEAYSLMADGANSDSYSNEAMAQLLVELEEHALDKMVIFAGYGGKSVRAEDNKMQIFLKANPGIRSRINSTFVFQPYSSEELWQIFKKQAELLQYEPDPDAKEMVVSYFEKRREDDNFGNGREARRLLELATSYMAERIMKKDTTEKEDFVYLESEDIRKAILEMNEASEQQHGSEKNKIGF